MTKDEKSNSSSYGSTNTASVEDTTTTKANVGSTFALCLCALTHAYLSVSVFPYAGFMAIDLIEGVDQENAGSYAGLIASSFMVGRFISSYWWGKIADTYGRTFTLYTSLLWSCVFVLLFGLASSFPMALFWRFCLGLGNGMVGTAKTTVSELAKGNNKVETTTMGWLIAMWGLAGLIGPALGGLLAEPVQQYPDFWSNTQWIWMRDFLNSNKFVLPNLAGAVFCLIAVVTISIFVEETLANPRSIACIPKDLVQKCTSIIYSRSSGTPLSEEESLPLNQDNSPPPQEAATLASLWARKSTRQHLLVYWGGSFVAVAADEIFPLFCISQQAGLGLQERGIGKILSLGALFFFILQHPIYSRIVHGQGLYPSIRIGLMVTIPLFLVLPSILLVDRWQPPAGEEGGLSWATLAYSTSLLAFYRVFGLIFFSSIQVALNRTVPDHQRATLNGFDMLGNSAVKSFGPFLAGLLFSFSVSSGIFPAGVDVMVPFSVVTFIGFLLTWATFSLEPGDDDNSSITEEKS